MSAFLLFTWLFIPAGFANMAAATSAKVPIIRNFTQPVDFGKTFRGKRILGNNKTIRGFMMATLTGGFVTSTQLILARNIESLATYTDLLDYTSPAVIGYGMVIGFGALFGDSLKSFFKRQIGVPPGSSWFPFDQLDFIAGAMFFSLAFFTLPWTYYLLGFGLALILHPTTKFVGWLMGIDDKPF